MKSKEEMKRALNRINVKLQLAPNKLDGWDIIKLYSDYPFEELNEIARNLKIKISGSILSSQRLVKETADFLVSPDVNIRATAEKALKDINNDECKRVLAPRTLNLRWISSPDLDPEFLADAAIFLGEMGDQESVGPLINALDHPHKVVRGSAAMALGRIGDERALPHLVKALEDQEIYVREKVAAATQNFPCEELIEPLVEAYKAHFDSKEVSYIRIRKHCSRALLNIGLPASALLTEITHRDEEPGIRIWAMTLLIIMGLLPEEELLTLVGEEIIDGHIELMPGVLRDLALDLALFRDYILLIIENTGNIEFLKAAVFTQDPLVRKKALEKLWQKNNEAFTELFSEVLICYWPAEKDLFLQFGEQLFPMIRQLLASGGSHVQVNCLQLLGEIGNLKGLQMLEENLLDEKSEIRGAALKVILKMDVQQVKIPSCCTGELVNLIGTEWENAALIELKKMDEVAIDSIKEDLVHMDVEIINKVILVLSVVRGEKAIRLLVRIWRHYRHLETGRQADQALTRLGYKSRLSRFFIR